jgi:hypothetical protein
VKKTGSGFLYKVSDDLKYGIFVTCAHNLYNNNDGLNDKFEIAYAVDIKLKNVS